MEKHPIKVTFRRMKSIRIMVNPPDGHITMSVPHGTTQKVIKAFVVERLAWLDASKAEVARRGPGIAVEAGGHTEICNARCERTVRAVDLGRKPHR